MQQQFVEFLFKQRDMLNKTCDSINLLNPVEIDEQDLYFYYCEFKRRERLEEGQEN